MIFISYSHENREICDRIAAIIRGLHHPVWYDTGLIPGEIYRKKIVDKIQEADFFLVLISQNSIRSEWVLDEVEYAKKRHKRILPIWIENAELPPDLEMILQRYHSLFWHLRGSDKQFEESLALCFDESSEQEKPPTQVGFGNEFSEQINIRMNQLLEKERREQFQDCYEAENACILGMAYLFGGPCAINRKKAAYYFKVASYQGNPDGDVYLLQMKMEEQERDTWDEPDPEFCAPVIEKIREHARNGSVAASLYLGNVYWYGKYGCAKDIRKSTELYEYCARKGDARAQYMMASNYYEGDGVPVDYDLAIMYANLALEQKYLKAWRRWGKFYRDGKAVPRDYEKARACYERGAAMGDYNCFNKVGDMLYYGWGFPVDYDAAFQYYRKGEQAPVNGQKYGLWKAKQALGRCYENGHGTEVNTEIALQMYLEGYRYGSEECKAAYLRLSERRAG